MHIDLKLPQGAKFSDLKVRRCDDDAIDLDMNLVQRLCQLNDWDFEKVRANPGPVISTILSVWYKQHMALGGEPDPVMESFRLQSEIAQGHPPH
jgi:hypothetical protein